MNSAYEKTVLKHHEKFGTIEFSEPENELKLNLSDPQLTHST